MILTVPRDEGDGYPSLGPWVVQWMHDNLVFGPGDLLGLDLELDEEQQGFIYSFYELFPRGHPEEGRRRFKRCALSIAKGLRKTELAAFVAAAELHPDAPVRFNGWDRGGNAKRGRGVVDPMVILCAYTEEQSDELCYGALRSIFSESPLRDDFDIGLDRIIRRDGAGKAISVAGSPNARDGARTTFQIVDESHWHTSDRLKRSHQTMLANIPKRKAADPWTLEVTTAPEPGNGSIAEDTMDYARQVADGKIDDARLFFYHRQASDDHDLTTEEGARAAIIEASGPAAEWRDIEGIVQLWKDPTTDRTYWERVWCNRLVQSSRQAFDVQRWRELQADDPVRDGDLITIGFDGALTFDATGIVCTHVETGFQWRAGLWERPYGAEKWKVSADEVDEVVAGLFERFTIWKMYADPPYWQAWLSKWQGQYGEKVVIEWWTNRRRPMAHALESYQTAITEGAVSHDGDRHMERHLGNACRYDLPQRNEEDGKPLWLIRKDRADSPYKIDLTMAGVLSWEARNDAIAAGACDDGEYRVRFA